MSYYSLGLYIEIFSNPRARNLFLRMILVVIVGFSIVTLSNEIFPTILEIKHIDNKVQATISKRALYSSFKKRVTFVPNVKEAIIERKLFSGVNFIVLLRDKAGKKYAINPNYSEPESTANQLAKRINTSIKSNIDFKFEILDKVKIICSIIGIVIPSMILYFWMLYDIKHPKRAIRILLDEEQEDDEEDEEDYYYDELKEKDEIAELKNYPVSEGELEKQALESPNPVEEPQKDDNKYNDINDSIIK